MLALSYYALGKCQETVPLLEKVSPHLPQGQADAPYILGVCYARLQQWENARKAFAGMFGVSPESPMAHLMLAKMLVRLQLEDQAPGEIEKALASIPASPWLISFQARSGFTRWMLSVRFPNSRKNWRSTLPFGSSIPAVGFTDMRLSRHDEA